jgi:hypothetical protein
MAEQKDTNEHEESLDELEAAANAALQALGLAQEPPRVRAKTDWTVEELYRADLPEPKWIVPGLLPTGLASLAGRPKLGKSWLALQLGAAVAVGGTFLERRVQEGRVLFIALEDPPRRLRERVRSLWVSASAPIQFYTEWPVLNSEQGLYELRETVAEWRPRLVVIDTLARAYDRRVEWNSVSEATEAMGVLQRMAHELECCVLTVDHHRKAGLMANVVDDILGSTGKAAVADTAWGLYKDRGARCATLRVTGRDIDTCELPMRFSEGGHCWLLRPAIEARTQLSQQEVVAEALRELGGAGTTEEIVRRTGMAKGNVSHALGKLVAAGRVRRRGREGHRVPYELVADQGSADVDGEG